MTDKENTTISGIVDNIQSGKDGYTAKIITNDSKIYFATISIPNLGKNAYKYKKFSIGSQITITGLAFTLREDNRITVKDIIYGEI